jgi:hypothetical protein
MIPLKAKHLEKRRFVGETTRRQARASKDCSVKKSDYRRGAVFLTASASMA